MSTVLAIDGRLHTGSYRVVCLCGDTWNGCAEHLGAFEWNPVTPLAEAVVHFKMEHASTRLELEISEEYREWLVSYWQHQSARADREHQRLARAAEARARR